ncbi:hypothetical protein MJI47_29650, partial [Salmonella enterica subsp. enterica serovar Kentucky]|nr:hypothetical protein [Salmonella enterica subsp. enterica serovar Kentucky]
VDNFEVKNEKQDYYFTASRMVPYKRIDLIVEAFSKMPEKKLVQNPQLHETLLTHLEQLQQHQGNTIKISYTTHEQFKKLTADSQ